MSVMIFVPETKRMKIEMFPCPLCKSSFYYERYLKRHMQRMHNVIQSKVSKKVHKCNICEKSFSSKSYMYKHRMIIHGTSPKRTPIKCQEENCNTEFSTLSKFRMHLDFIHNFADFNIPEKLRFNSLSSFIEWLVVEEKNTKCKFIRPRGRFKRPSYTGIDYTCSQNRHFFSQSAGQRVLKSQDPTVSRYHCTAQILVKEFGNHVEVLYFKRHYKHDFFFSSPKLFIRRKKIEKIVDTTDSACEETFSLTEQQYCLQSENNDIPSISECISSDLCIKSVSQQLDAIRSKLMSKTSIDTLIALKISESLQIVEKLLDNDTLQNIIKTSSELSEPVKNCKLQQKVLLTTKKNHISSEENQISNINIFLNEIFVSTSSANDHDYDKT